jgi:MFS family permease
LRPAGAARLAAQLEPNEIAERFMVGAIRLIRDYFWPHVRAALRALIRLGGYSATQAGATLLPFALIMGFGSSLAGALSDRIGPRFLLTAGPIIAAGGLTLLGASDIAESFWVSVFPGVCILAFGMTMTVPPLTSTVMSSVGETRAGVASGVNNAVARIAGLLAVAGLSTVLFASFARHLPGVAPAQTSEALTAVMTGQTTGADVAAAFRAAIKTVMWLSAVCAAVAGCIGLVLIGRVGKVGAARSIK